eukprot:1145493-Pelagomonas_calceolata.AAC.1
MGRHWIAEAQWQQAAKYAQRRLWSMRTPIKHASLQGQASTHMHNPSKKAGSKQAQNKVSSSIIMLEAKG